MAEKKQVYSCHKTSYPDSSFFLPAMSPLSTLILMEYSLRRLSRRDIHTSHQCVLILILMEYSLRLYDWGCFNIRNNRLLSLPTVEITAPRNCGISCTPIAFRKFIVYTEYPICPFICYLLQIYTKQVQSTNKCICLTTYFEKFIRPHYASNNYSFFTPAKSGKPSKTKFYQSVVIS